MKPVFQVNLGLSDEVIRREPIPVHDRDSEGVVERKGGRKLKHFAKDWIEIAGDIVILVIDDRFVSKFHFDIWVRFSIWISRLKVDSLCVCVFICHSVIL